MSKDWHVVIGLEVHAQLTTESKLFSRAATRYGAKPNEQSSYVDCALPGTLPVLNREAVKQAIRFGIATHSTIQERISFDRKNYFYPDLPKGYQITQHYRPILIGGHVDIETDEGAKRIHIHHSHLEEDAGKSNHEYSPTTTGIDLNRAGMPLLEIVSEPEMRSPKEAVAYIKALHKLIVFLEICDGNMQEGSMRVDVNISLRESEDAPFGTKVEIKNINSFKFVEKALNHEIMRQADILESGETVLQETRLFNESTGQTEYMRGKEDAHDYRYHKDPDIPYIDIDEETISQIRNNMPESPQDKQKRYSDDLKLSDYDARVISHDKDYATLFDTIMSEDCCQAKTLANWILGPISEQSNKSSTTFHDCPITIKQLAKLLSMLEHSKISNNNAKVIFEKMWSNGDDPEGIIKSEGLEEINDIEKITAMIDDVLHANPKQVEQFLNGNHKLIGFFVGQVMKQGQGKVNPKVVNEILKTALDKRK